MLSAQLPQNAADEALRLQASEPEKREILWFDMVIVVPAGIVALSVFGSLIYNIVLGDDVVLCVFTMGLGLFTVGFFFTLLAALERFKETIDDAVSSERSWVLDHW